MISHCFSLPLLISVSHVSFKFSKPSFLSTFPRNFNRPFFFILIISFLYCFIFLKKSLCLRHSVNGIFSILQQYRISAAFSVLLWRNCPAYIAGLILCCISALFMFGTKISCILIFWKASFMIPTRFWIPVSQFYSPYGV